MERFNQFSTLENDLENQNFKMFEEIVHNFGKSDHDIIFSEKVLISNRRISGLMSNLIKKSWTDSILESLRERVVGVCSKVSSYGK